MRSWRTAFPVVGRYSRLVGPAFSTGGGTGTERRLRGRARAHQLGVRQASSGSAAALPNEAHATSTLVDRFGRQHTYLRLSMTEKCNLRCQYCMPEDGIPLQHQEKLLSGEELVEIADMFISEGVDKIRLTGGEPLLSPHVDYVCENVGANEAISLLGITTNGLLLPRKLPKLLDYGVNRINVSLDTLVEPKFEFLTRRRGLHRVLQSIDDAVVAQEEQNQRGWANAGSGAPRPPLEVKMNVVMMKNVNDDEICDFVEFTRERPVNVRFIEFMPFNDNKWNHDKFLSYKHALGMICADSRFQDSDGNPLVQPLKNHPNDTSKGFKVDGFAGQIGFISSMTENFCRGCNRVRVTADGDLKVCLFGDENDSVSLRDIMRAHPGSKAERAPILSQTVHGALSKKHHSLGGNKNMFELSKQSGKNRSMIRIGGFSTLAGNDLTHISTDAKTGEKMPKMVDVGGKTETVREARARATIEMPMRVVEKVQDGKGPKGAVFSTAIIAGTMGAKKTSDLIPFCHPLQIEKCKIDISVKPEVRMGQYDEEIKTVDVTCTVRCSGKTGVEMEALTGCSVAALAIYDMTKAMSHNIVISNIHLMKKTGGKSDYMVEEEAET
jgi:GTP 3',8-cyclase / cyclic pyranopterin monophosphate synthase|eukprot:g6589.t1